MKDLGVLQPIRAVRTSEGALRVETGHRRTLAAIEAGLATVPVLVVADERSDDAGTVERIVRQYAENEHRTGLTTTDRLGVVEQLALLNVSAAQIAKRTRMKRPQVDQALAVTRSDLAKTASVRYELTIDQAAGVAEFEDAPTVKALVAAAKTGQFAHVLERARQDRADAAQRAQAEADLAATGVRVIDAPSWSGLVKRLGWVVRDAKDNELTAEEHAMCPGHVAWVEQEWVNVAADGQVYDDDTLDAMDEDQRPETETVRRWVPVLGCEDPTTHHPRPGTTAAVDGVVDEGEAEAEAAARAEAASAERRRVIAGNKAWDAAVNVRRAWLQEFFQRKTPPTGAAAFIAAAVLTGDHAVRRAFEQTHPLAVDLFGIDAASPTGKADDGEGGNRVTYPGYTRRADLTTLLDGASDKRLTLVTLAVVMAAYEAALDRHSWRHENGCSEKHYPRYLDTLGYTLCDVERLAAGLQPLTNDHDDKHDEQNQED